MARVYEFKTNFTAGELDPKLRARTDVKFYYNGAAKMRNVFVFPQGGARRRDGLAFNSIVPLASTDIGTYAIAAGTPRQVVSANGESFAIRFTTQKKGRIRQASFNVAAYTASGTYEARVYTNNAGSPGVQVGVASDSQVITAIGKKTFTFPTNATELDAATAYWLVFAKTAGTPNFTVDTVANQASFASGQNNVITSIVDGLPSSADWKAEIMGATGVSEVKIIPFVFSDTQRYLFVLYDRGARIYKNGAVVADITLPFTSSEIRLVNSAQNLDTLLLFHADHETVKVQRAGSDANWTVGTWEYTNIPQYAFGGVVYVNGVDEVQNVDLALASSGTYSLVLAGEQTVGITHTGTPATNATNIQNALNNLTITAGGITVVHAGSNQYTVTFGGGDGDKNWGTMEVKDNTSGGVFVSTTTPGSPGGEDVWSDLRGWPVCGTFYQGRLWLAGSRDLPNRIWGSRPGLPLDFNTGKDLDDYGIEAEALSDEVPYFYYIYGGTDLQFFSSTGEWFISKSLSSTGITPNNFTLKKATSRGSEPGLSVFEIDGGTIFPQRKGKSLREFIYADTEQNYQSNSLSILSSHMLNSPKSIALRRATSTDDADYVLHVNGDGTMAVFCTLRNQDINAWTLQITDGKFLAAGVDDTTMYFGTERTIDGEPVRYIESFVPGLKCDCGFYNSDLVSPVTVVNGLDALEGREVEIVLDGNIQARQTVTGGSITFDREAEDSYQIGLPFPDVSDGLGYGYYIETLPPEVQLQNMATIVGKKKRIPEVTMRLEDTGEIKLNENRLSLRTYGSDLLDQTVAPYTGDHTEDGLLGWDDDGVIRIGDNLASPMTLLGLAYKVSV